MASYYPLDLQYDRTLWDKKIDELEAILDPLDRMSVIIRNVALALYKDTKQSYRNWKAFSKDIENVCSENKEALTQLQNLRFAYQSILDGRVNAMAQWKDAVESIAVHLPKRYRINLNEMTGDLQSLYFAMSYNDYKNIDGRIVQGAPSILSKVEDTVLVIPQCEDEEVHNALLHACIIEPDYIYFDGRDEADGFIDFLFEQV